MSLRAPLPKKKRKKKSDRAKRLEYADSLARGLVHARGYCQAAGLDRIKCGGSLQWCHIEGRSNKRLKWELWNALCMCAGHHTYYTHHPIEWSIFIEEKFPENHKLIRKYINESWDKDIEKTIKYLEKEKENSSNAIDFL